MEMSALKPSKKQDNPKLKVGQNKKKTAFPPNERLFGSVQYEIPESVRRRTVNRAFITDDSLEFDDFHEDFMEIVELDNSFKFLVFCEYFLYHFLFSFCLGPLLPIICWPFFRSFTVFRNMGFWGFKTEFFIQSFGFFFVFFSIFGYFYYLPENTYSIEVCALISSTVLRLCVISIKYAHFSEKKLKYMKHVILTEKQIQSEFILEWGNQTDFMIDKEIYTCILKNNIDTSVFRMFFLKPLNKFQEKKLTIEKIDLESPSSNTYTSSRLSINEHFMENDLWFKSLEIVKKNMMFHNLDGHGGAYSGYMIARYLIKENKENFLNTKKIIFLSAFLSLISSLIPTIFRYHYKETFFGNEIMDRIITASIIVGNVFYNFTNYALLFVTIVEVNRTINLLSQLSNLISSKKALHYYRKKYLPTLNLFCPISFKCWIFLNQIFRTYGEKYFVRMEMILGLFLFYNLFISMLLFLSIYKIISIVGSAVDIFYLSFGMFSMFVVIFITLFKGAIINEFYEIHRDILKTNKNVISDYIAMYDLYFENPNFESDNEIYYHGVKLWQSFNEGLPSNIKKQRISDHLQILLSLYDAIIEELAFAKERRPFKVFGIATSNGLIKSLLAGLGTVLVAALQKIFVQQ